jgi:PAS domain S-box-containing protein
VNCSDDAIIGLSIDGIILSWNRGAEKLYGFNAEEAKGKEIAMIVPADRADEFRRIAEKLKRGETVDSFRTVGVGKDGRRIDVSVSTSPIKDFENEFEAEIARGHLRSAGIDAILSKDDAGDMLPSLQETEGVSLLVLPEDRKKANALLHENQWSRGNRDRIAAEFAATS